MFKTFTITGDKNNTSYGLVTIRELVGILVESTSPVLMINLQENNEFIFKSMHLHSNPEYVDNILRGMMIEASVIVGHNPPKHFSNSTLRILLCLNNERFVEIELKQCEIIYKQTDHDQQIEYIVLWYILMILKDFEYSTFENIANDVLKSGIQYLKEIHTIRNFILRNREDEVIKLTNHLKIKYPISLVDMDNYVNKKDILSLSPNAIKNCSSSEELLEMLEKNKKIRKALS